MAEGDEMSVIDRWKTQTAYECPECGALHRDCSGECHLECGDGLREVSVVAEHHLQGAVDLIRELREAGIYALGPHAEYEEHERWRRAAKHADTYLGGQ